MKSVASFFAAAETSLQVCPTNGAFAISHWKNWKTQCQRRPALSAFKTRRRRFRLFSSKSPPQICTNINHSLLQPGFRNQERSRNNLQNLIIHSDTSCDHCDRHKDGIASHLNGLPEDPSYRAKATIIHELDLEYIIWKYILSRNVSSTSRNLTWNILSGNIYHLQMYHP